MTYTNDEKVWWITKHVSGSSYRDVSEEFYVTFLHRPQPHNTTIKWCCDRFCNTRCITYHRKGTQYQVAESLNETVVLASVHSDPRRSTNAIARETGLSQSTVWRKLRKNKFQPFKVHTGQELRPEDRERRLEFAGTVLEMLEEDPCILS